VSAIYEPNWADYLVEPINDVAFVTPLRHPAAGYSASSRGELPERINGRSMTAFRPKADAEGAGAECLLVTHSCHPSGSSRIGSSRPETVARGRVGEGPLPDQKADIRRVAATQSDFFQDFADFAIQKCPKRSSSKVDTSGNP
jgi:hypothetical protein